MSPGEPTVLHVFISSPGDCAEERDLVESVLAEVNASDEARRSGIELKPLRWENLPPGETRSLDYQGRIDDLLVRVGLDRFEIYLGFMRERVGTPTRGQPSGTLSELQSALARRRRTGLPAEILFYFLCDPKAMPPAVAAIRRDLERRGFLYSVAADRALFRRRLHAHLLQVVLGWWRWRNRLRRQVGNLKFATASVAVALLLGYLAVEAYTLHQLQAELRAGSQEAAVAMWRARGTYLPITRLTAERDVMEALDTLAARRLIDALVAQGLDPFTWKREHLRPFEISALTDYALARVRSDPMLQLERSSAMRLALVALTEDWTLARRFARIAAGQDGIHDPPEIRSFIANAPAGDVVAWLRDDLSRATPAHVAGRILEGVARRADPSVTFAALDALHAGRLGSDARGFDLNLSCDAENAPCAVRANAMVLDWLRAEVPPSPAALALVMSWTSPERMAKADRAVMEDEALRLLDDASYSEASGAVIRLLAKSGSDEIHRELRRRIEMHIAGRISFGFAEKAALLDALSLRASEAGDRLALTVAKRAADEAASLPDARHGPSDGPVQAAYLRVLARTSSADWQRHHPWIEKTLDRRLRGDFPEFWRTDVDSAFSTLLAGMDQERFIQLFVKPVAPIVDSIDGRLSARRAYLLDLVPKSYGMLPKGVVEAVCRSVPALESNRPSFYRALARHGGDMGLSCLRNHLDQDAKVMRYLGLANDLPTLLENLARVRSTRSRLDVEDLLTAVRDLSPEQQAEFVAAAAQRPEYIDPAALWSLAAASGSPVGPLVEAAVAELSRAESAARVAGAIAYLSKVSPRQVWHILASTDAAQRFAALMEHVEVFDWIRIAQVLPDAPSDVFHGILATALVSRRVLVSFDDSQVDRTAKLSDRLMSMHGKVVGNPIGRLVVLHADRSAADTLLRSRDGKVTNVEVLGSIPAASAAYRAYTNWLLAEVIASLSEQERAVIAEGEITGWIVDSDPVASRAMAGLTIAVLSSWR